MAPSPENDSTPKAPDKNEKTKHGNSDGNKEKNKDLKTLNNLNDCELKDLLDEAITYKNPKDREGKSSLFKELLSQAEESERNARAASAGGSEQVRYCNTSAKRSKHRRKPNSISENVMHGGSLDNLAKEELFEVSHHLNRPKRTVSARQKEGGSLPSNVNAGSLASAYVVPHFLVEARTRGGVDEVVVGASLYGGGAGGGVTGGGGGGIIDVVEPMDVDMETVSLLDHDSVAENYEGSEINHHNHQQQQQAAAPSSGALDVVEGAGAQLHHNQHQQQLQQQQSVPKFTTKATLQVNVDDGLHFNDLESSVVEKKPYEIDHIAAKVVQSKYSVYIQNYSPLNNEATKKVDENGNALHQNATTTSKNKKKKIQSDKNVVSCVAAEKVEGHRSDIIHDVKKLLEFIGEKPNPSHHHHHHHHQGGGSDKKGGVTGSGGSGPAHHHGGGSRANKQQQQLQKHSSEEGATVPASYTANSNSQKTNNKKQQQQQQIGQNRGTTASSKNSKETPRGVGVVVSAASDDGEGQHSSGGGVAGDPLKKSNSLGEISTAKMGYGDDEEGDEEEEDEDDEEEVPRREVVLRRKGEVIGRTDSKRERRSWGNAEHQPFHNIYKNPSLDNIESSSSADFHVVTKKKKTKKRRNSLSGSRREISTNNNGNNNNSPPVSTTPPSRHFVATASVVASSGAGAHHGGAVVTSSDAAVSSAPRKSAFSVPHSEKSNDDSSDDADSVRSLPIDARATARGGGGVVAKKREDVALAAAAPVSYAQIAKCAEKVSKKPSPTPKETTSQQGAGAAVSDVAVVTTVNAPAVFVVKGTTAIATPLAEKAPPPDVRNVKCFPAIQPSATSSSSLGGGAGEVSNNSSSSSNNSNNNNNGGVVSGGKSEKKSTVSSGSGKGAGRNQNQQQQQQQVVGGAVGVVVVGGVSESKQQEKQMQTVNTIGDIQSDLSIIQANEMETIRYNAHIVPTIQMTDVSTIEKIHFMNHHQQQHHHQPPPPPPHHVIAAPVMQQQHLHHPHHQIAAAHHHHHHHHQGLPLVPLAAAPPNVHNAEIYSPNEARGGVAYAIVATHVVPPPQQQPQPPQQSHNHPQNIQQQAQPVSVAYVRSAYEGAGVAYSSDHAYNKNLPSVVVAAEGRYYGGGGKGVVVAKNFKNNGNNGGEEAATKTMTTRTKGEETTRRLHQQHHHRQRSGGGVGVNEEETTAPSKPPPVVILSDVVKGGVDETSDGGVVKGEAASSVPGLVFGFDVNEQLLCEDICENFVRKYVAPECYTATSHNHEKIVNFVGLAWEEVRKNQSSGKARYYTEDL